jgi:hypothetical protein
MHSSLSFTITASFPCNFPWLLHSEKADLSEGAGQKGAPANDPWFGFPSSAMPPKPTPTRRVIKSSHKNLASSADRRNRRSHTKLTPTSTSTPSIPTTLTQPTTMPYKTIPDSDFPALAPSPSSSKPAASTSQPPAPAPQPSKPVYF